MLKIAYLLYLLGAAPALSYGLDAAALWGKLGAMGAGLSLVGHQRSSGGGAVRAEARAVRAHMQRYNALPLQVLEAYKQTPDSVKSKSPEGCILMTMLAMLEYSRDPVAGTSMLVHCLDQGFVATRQPGRPPALRLADQAFLEEHLLVSCALL